MIKAMERQLGAGSIAWLASGLGPRIAFAPEGGGGEGDDKGGQGAGEGGEKEGEKGGAGEGEGGDKGGALKGAGGLLGTRKPKEGEGAKKDAGEGEGEPKGGADGRPAHIPEKFWDADKKAVKTDELAKAYGTIEKAHGELKRSKGLGADVPETPDEYFADGLELDATVDRLTIEGPDDPGLKAWGKIAHKFGIGKEAATGIAREMFKEMNAFAPPPVDLEAERESLGDGAEELIDGVYLWLENQERAGKFGAADIDVAVGISHTADGIRFLNKMRSLSGEKPIPMGLPSGHKAMSQEDWHSEMRAAVKAKDYKRQEELDAMGPAIFGSDGSTGSPIAGIPNQKDVDRHAKK